MHNRHRATLRAIFAEPTPAGIEWSAIESLLVALGADVTEGNGSRVRVVLAGVRAVFHRPHPQKEAKRYLVRDVRDYLKQAGVEP
ncbi:MAG: type II toxin-antitoxin system HicA family toxin [Pseudomonadota bacterium]